MLTRIMNIGVGSILDTFTVLATGFFLRHWYLINVIKSKKIPVFIPFSISDAVQTNLCQNKCAIFNPLLNLKISKYECDFNRVINVGREDGELGQ